MFDAGILGFALAAGLVAAFNPCGFAMLPAYLTLVVLGDDRSSGSLAAVSRALAATAIMAFGFLLVFGGFGLLIAPLASEIQRYLPFATVVIGVVLVALGGWLLAGRELTILLPKPRGGAPTGQLGSMFGYGLAYALASLSCTVGPFLAVIGQTFRSDTSSTTACTNCVCSSVPVTPTTRSSPQPAPCSNGRPRRSTASVPCR